MAMRLLVLGTGAMAATHARAFQAIPGVTLAAGVDVDKARAAAFAKTHGMADSFGDLDQAITWDKFDAVTNVTPDPIHHPTTLKLLAAGKPVFCEKPLAQSYPLAREMAEAAKKAKLVNMVNLTYRNVPALQKARKLIADGEIGEVRHVEASYRQSWLVGNHWGDWKTDPKWLWRLSEKHGSRGVLGDVGIHILDFTLYATGLKPLSLQARLKTFDKAPGNKIGDYPLDVNDSAILSLAFDNGALGVVHTSRFMTGYANTLRLQVFGTEGALELNHDRSTSLKLCSGPSVNTLSWTEVECPPVTTNYVAFVEAVRTGKGDRPDFADAAELQRQLDACFEPAAASGFAL